MPFCTTHGTTLLTDESSHQSVVYHKFAHTNSPPLLQVLSALAEVEILLEVLRQRLEQRGVGRGRGRGLRLRPDNGLIRRRRGGRSLPEEAAVA